MNLSHAVRGQPHPPCEHCNLRVKCATQKLVCQDFTNYMNLKVWHSAHVRVPSRARYIKAFECADEETNDAM